MSHIKASDVAFTFLIISFFQLLWAAFELAVKVGWIIAKILFAAAHHRNDNYPEKTPSNPGKHRP